ncbi:MAG: hypothetical protein ACYCZU_00995 [Devosia sp.]
MIWKSKPQVVNARKIAVAMAAGVVLAATASAAMAAYRLVPGLTGTAFAAACERAGGTIEEGSAGAGNALVCKLPNGTTITCGFAEQPPMCVWREDIPRSTLRDLLGDMPDSIAPEPAPPKGLSSGAGDAPSSVAPPPGSDGKDDQAPGPDSGPDTIGDDPGPVVK